MTAPTVEDVLREVQARLALIQDHAIKGWNALAEDERNSDLLAVIDAVGALSNYLVFHEADLTRATEATATEGDGAASP